MEQFDDIKWKKTENRCTSFQLGDEPEMIHVIKTGFKNQYMVLHEDAYELRTGEVEHFTKDEVEKKYNITI